VTPLPPRYDDGNKQSREGINMRRTLLKSAALLGLLCVLPGFASADWQPTRAIKMICPFPAGGGTDLIARLAAKHLSDRLGQQVYVENRGGANGSIGVQGLMQSEPDGYTIGAISDGPMIVNPALYPNNPYVPLRDFIPVGQMIKFPSLLTAHPSVGVKNVAELVALAKAKPGTLNFSSGGIGNFSHMGLELLAIQSGMKIVHVPYKGVGPATLAVLSGEVQIMYNNVATAIEHVRGGKTVALGVGEPKRIEGLPDIPAIAETVPGFEMAAWVGIFVPAKTPAPIVDRLTKETAAFLQDPEVKKYFAQQFIVASYKNPEEFSQYIKVELDRWANVVKTAGIKGE
jgi:tripartite-type tricarboxylate transporter receptor subunit TctC